MPVYMRFLMLHQGEREAVQRQAAGYNLIVRAMIMHREIAAVSGQGL